MHISDYRIPIGDWNLNAGNYHSIPFDPEDKRYLEPLVKLSDARIAGESFYARRDGENWPYHRRIEGSLPDLWVRQSIAARLTEVNRRLQPHGVELFVWDAYRPVACQRGLWDFFELQVRAELPHASADEVRSLVLKYISDPSRFDADDPNSWPVHTSGAAVDLTLRDIGSGDLLDMGAKFDEMTSVSHSDYYERELAERKIAEDDARLRNRRLLHWAMSQQGFTNYPLEFWHFDWGDQMYVWNLQQGSGGHPRRPKKAWYGYVSPPLPET